MGIFSTPNPFDGIIEKVTDAKNTAEDWGHIMDLCDQVQQHKNGAKECLKAIVKRLNHQDPHVVLQAVTVLDACANNCGKEFRLEIASREFENEFRRILGRTQPKVQEKLRGLLKSWAEGEFKGDSQLSLIPSLYQKLKQEGMDFSSASDDPTSKKRVQQVSKDPNVVSSQQEEDDIAKAIQMSLNEGKSGVKSSGASVASSSSTLYPSNSLYGGLAAAGASVAAGGNTSSAGTSSSSSPKKDEKKARALYDFEAAEDNEMTFKAGEIVIIIDNSDANWWKGSNHRGEGLFPANFVSTDLNTEPEQFKEQRRRSVQFNEEVEVVTTAPILVEDLSTPEVSEEKIDNVLQLLHEADPTQPESDAPQLPAQEDQVYRMGPLIDAELEAVDRRHAQLTRLSTELVDALNLYHQLMHENIQNQGGGYGMPLPNGGYNPYVGPTSLPHQQQQQPPQFNGGYYPQPPVSSAPGMVPPGTYPTQAAPQPQAPTASGTPGGENNQIYAGSAPPPPTPTMPHHYPAKQGVPPLQQPPPQSHFLPQQAAMAAEWLNSGGGLPSYNQIQPPVVSGYQNPPMPQM